MGRKMLKSLENKKISLPNIQKYYKIKTKNNGINLANIPIEKKKEKKNNI